MTVQYYGPGKHSSGFVGFYVSVNVNNALQEDYFATDHLAFNSPEFKKQKLRAELKCAEWEAEAAWQQYQREVTTNHPDTKPGRGVGVHGLTLDFYDFGEDAWEPVFEVHGESDDTPIRRFSMKGKYFSQVWFFAVNCWADERGVLDEDRQRLLDNPPSPDQFKELRHIRNEEGDDIPVEVLGHVFAERRANLQAQRGLARARTGDAPAKSAPQESDVATADVAAWFEQELAKLG